MYTIRKYSWLLLIWLLSMCNLYSQNIEELAYISYWQKVLDSTQFDNPALMQNMYSVGFNGIEISMVNSENQKFYQPQIGNKTKRNSLSFNGYTQNKFTLYSHANYNYGYNNNVNWNSILHDQRIGPYILADSVGGKKYIEEYSLGAGISGKYKTLAWGIEGKFQAKNSYRKNDPRPLSNITVFTLKPGVSAVLGNYHLGLHFGMERYLQYNKIRRFSDSESDKYIFFLKGLGFYDKTLSIYTSLFRANYVSSAFSSGIQFVPVNQQGFYTTFKWLFYKTKLQYDKITPNIYRITNIKGKLGWQKNINHTYLHFSCSFEYKKGKGTERIYENIIVGSDPPVADKRLLTQGDYYSLTQSKLSSSLFASQWIKPNTVRLTTHVFGELNMYDETYIALSQLKRDDIVLGIKPSLQYIFKNSTFEVLLGYTNKIVVNNTQVGIPNHEIKDELVVPNWEYLTSGYSDLLFQLKYLIKINKGNTLFARLQYLNRTSNNILFNQYSFNLGINF